jgi:hypothetical protein
MLACALLAGVDPPIFPETAPDIVELKARVATVKDFNTSIPPSQIDGTEEKEVVLPSTTDRPGSLPASRCC